MIFDALEILPDDPVGLTYMALAKDPNPNKIDLGIGVYRDDAGRSPIMASVREAQARLIQKQTTKEYMTPSGNLHYCRLMERLVLGEGHAALGSERLLTIQTPGAGGGLRTAADLIKAANPNATVWVSAPTWSHQRLVIAAAGLRIAEYPYYDTASNRLTFAEMLAALGNTSRNDVVLLHGCCHNPTGADLEPEQWRAITKVLNETGALPCVDLVYQGFGSGIEEDAFGTRLLAATSPEMIIVASSSKSFGIYRDRAGTISILGRGASDIKNAARHLSKITRALYFMPPDTGAAIVVELLENPALEKSWRAEVDAMRNRIVALRKTFAYVLQRALPSLDFGFIVEQKGMFSLLPLSSPGLLTLRQEHGIYLMPDARINLAALTEANVQRVGDAIAAVMAQRPKIPSEPRGEVLRREPVMKAG